jgi:hypothetical protein
MTRKRYLTAIGLLAALACAGLVVTLMLSARTNVTKAHFDQIKQGMTKAEVEEVLGVPGFEFPWTGVRSFAWRVDNGDLMSLTFDASHRVVYRYWWRRETMSEKIRRWLGVS